MMREATPPIVLMCQHFPEHEVKQFLMSIYPASPVTLA